MGISKGLDAGLLFLNLLVKFGFAIPLVNTSLLQDNKAMQLLAHLRLKLERQTLFLLDKFLRPSAESEAEHLLTGRRGEEEAFFYLRKMGYIVVARGWRSHKAPGDIDLIAWQGSTLCFVEVKTRASRAVATAESAVDKSKRTMLRRMARTYLNQFSHEEPPPARFDILSIYLHGNKVEEILHFPSAFGWVELPIAERL